MPSQEDIEAALAVHEECSGNSAAGERILKARGISIARVTLRRIWKAHGKEVSPHGGRREYAKRELTEDEERIFRKDNERFGGDPSLAARDGGRYNRERYIRTWTALGLEVNCRNTPLSLETIDLVANEYDLSGRNAGQARRGLYKKYRLEVDDTKIINIWRSRGYKIQESGGIRGLLRGITTFNNLERRV